MTAPKTGPASTHAPEHRSPEVSDTNGLSLTRTGQTANGRVEGVLTTLDGRYAMTATVEGWAQLVRDVAAGRNPLLLETLLTDPEAEEEASHA